ncbi:PDDEXK nuclease domain-containing protein [Leyella stercorea]|uniref:PDDEXK nuclease domain-containing protein n=1 Tax=Leyella stercorea TaxID=363265 RepID=UPI00242CCC26|nr:PDDEXK nuclease domain-containing protein [Leyella stercorea]
MSKDVSSIASAVQAIKTAILQGQYEASIGVNRVQLATYYGVGRYLSQHTRKGVWGTGALKAISEQLQREMPGLRGFSAESLKLMRRFYEGWIMLDANSSVVTGELQDGKQSNSVIAITKIQEIDEQIDTNSVIAITQLREFPVEDFFRVPFTHHIRIADAVKDLKERYYYIHRTAEEHLSVDGLKRAIANDAYHHQDTLPNNFNTTISNAAMARKAVMMFKDEYMLNFINTEQIGERDSEDVDERVVEHRIVQNIKNFIMTFGRDFAFIGNQYLLEVYGVEHFPDLLFFNRELNCMVCVELKTGTFKSAYLGQLMAYLTILDDKVKKVHENPSIGIVLCKDAKKEYVEYIIRDYNKPMGVATYKTASDMPEPLRRALPNEEQFSKLLEGYNLTEEEKD